MRKILDKMFENRKLSILIPILVSVLLYLLFIIFGVAEDKMNIIIATPIAAAFWFFGVFFVPLRGVGCDHVCKMERIGQCVIVPLRGVGCDGKAAQIRPQSFVQICQKYRR